MFDIAQRAIDLGVEYDAFILRFNCRTEAEARIVGKDHSMSFDTPQPSGDTPFQSSTTMYAVKSNLCDECSTITDPSEHFKPLEIVCKLYEMVIDKALYKGRSSMYDKGQWTLTSLLNTQKNLCIENQQEHLSASSKEGRDPPSSFG
ncbi:hypothetical protein TNCV_2781231 [Trichonephila clavipes]|nr:hypothetical protein TNCV_2781231 [Trichonephila clavipes]